MSSYIRINGSSFEIVKADGTTVTFDEVLDKAKTLLPDSMWGNIRVQHNQGANSMNISFPDEYYVRNSTERSQEETRRMRGHATAKRFAILGVVTSLLHDEGLEFGSVLNPRDSARSDERTKDDKVVYKPTTQLYVNLPQSGTTHAAPVQTDEQLLAKAYEVNMDAVDAMLGKPLFYADGKLTQPGRGKLQALINLAKVKNQAASTPDTPAPAPAQEATDDMPVD